MNRHSRTGLCVVSLIIFFFCGAVSLPAQEFRFVSFFDYYGGIEPEDGYENVRTRLFMHPRFSGFNTSLNFEWVLSAQLWAQPLGEQYAIDAEDILFEAYLMFPFEKFDFSLGQKLVTYGFADVYGPLNILHSENKLVLSLDESYDKRRPDPLIQIRFYPTFEDTIELTYVPVTRPDRERTDQAALPQSSDTVVWSDDPYITDPLHSVFFTYSRYGRKADIQLLYGWYVEHTPDFRVPETELAISSDITAVYRKKHTFGAAYSTRLGNSTLSQDFAFNLTEDLSGTDIGAQNSDITINTQLLTNLPADILGQFTLVYSCFINHDEYDPGSDPDAAGYLASEIQSFHNQPLQHIAFVVGHFERTFFRNRLKAQLNTAFFFSPKIYIAPRFAYSLTDYWAFEGGADITLGDPPDYDLRRNPSNDNFYVRMVYRY